jgi:outer membrane receptor protein involved in Fe transport
LGGLDRLAGISDAGASRDDYRQKDTNWAVFTHNVITVTDKLSVTLGARYTHDKKTLNANVLSDSNACSAQRAAIGALAAGGNALAGSLLGLTCATSVLGGDFGPVRGVDGAYTDKKSDSEWTGTAVVSYKPTDRLMTYLSWSRGFKAGGFNLDRAGLVYGNPQSNQFRFAAEKVDAWELGAKYRGHGYRLGFTAFYQMFDNFQLNTFNGTSFIVENIQGCSALTGGDGADSDLSGATGACNGANKSGVTAKGIELEASIYPTSDLSFDLGYTYAQTEYRGNITGLGGRSLATVLFQLPGSPLSNAPRHVATGGATWTPAIGGSGLNGLIHVDGRYQSKINTGSDLLPEKYQKSVSIINARLGLTGKEGAWGVELWAQNLFDTNYKQVVAGAPIQGTGSLATVAAGGATPGNGLFIVFPAEPRTWGMTVRTKF